MNCSPDAFRARKTLRATTSSLYGFVTTLLIIGLLIWLLLPLTISYLQGKYYQYLYWVQAPTYDHINIPSEFRTAIVFHNKTSNKIANHSLLQTYATFTTFISNYLGVTNRDGVQLCDPNYFSNTINPTTLSDCFIFPTSTYIDLSYYQQSPTSFGFDASFSCSNPFDCSVSSTYYSSTATIFRDLFANYSFTLYFTSRVLTSNAQFKDQLFSISSNEWNTPFTTTTNIYTELSNCNVTLDDSISPWQETKRVSFSTWQGIATGSAITYQNSFTSPPKATFVSGNYQMKVFRYYQKVDELMGLIGGCIFLVWIIFSIPIGYLNRCLYRVGAAEELLIEHDFQEGIQKGQQQRTSFRSVKVKRRYILTNILPFCDEDAYIRQIKMHLDIVRMIKLVHVAHKNIEDGGLPLLYSNQRTLNVNENNNENDVIQLQQTKGIDDTRQQLNEPIPASSKRKTLQKQKQSDTSSNEERQLAQQLNMDLQVLKAILQSGNASQLYSLDLQVQALKSKKEQYQQLLQGFEFSHHPPSHSQIFFQKVVNVIHSLFKCIDSFSVSNGFSIPAKTYCGCSCFCTIVFTLLLGLLISMTAANLNQYQVMISKSTQEAEDIHYTVQTGDIFRPFYCFHSSTPVNAITSTTPTYDLTFFNKKSSGMYNLKTINLASSRHSYLGITADSPFYTTISTQNCFIMEDGQDIQMGGYNTDKQAYFGIKVTPHCSGTANYCQSINATLRASMLTYLQSYPSTLYLPINQYNETTKNVTSAGFYGQPFRKGTSSFNAQGAIQETIYIDQMRLLDGYSIDFVNRRERIIDQTMTSDRYQKDANVEGINVTVPYHEIRVRPSGVVSDNILRGYTLDIFFAIVGGIAFLLWLVLHWFTQTYNDYLTRLSLLQENYKQDIYLSPHFVERVWTAFPWLSLCCCSESFTRNVKKLRICDKMIKREINGFEIVKGVNTIAQLSTVNYNSFYQKICALAYFKKPHLMKNSHNINHMGRHQQIRNNNRRVPQEEHEQFQSESQVSENSERSQLLHPQNNKNVSKQQQILADVKDKYRSPQGLHTQQDNWLNYLDAFSSQSELTLQGQWRVSSCLGGLFTLLVVACVLIMYAYSLNLYDKNRHQTISFDQKMLMNPANEPPFVLNSSNYRLALGFYIKPNTTFLDISQYINSSSTVQIGLTKVTLSRDSSSGTVTQTNSSSVNLVPCSSDYFNGFKDSNTDYSFMSGLTNAYCLPTDLSIQLTSISENTMMYAVIQIYDTVSSSSTALSSLLQNYVVGLYMTVPIVDLQTKSFKNSVKQIRGHLEPTSNFLTYNLTLSKQEMIFSNANYTISPNTQTISTFNYLNYPTKSQSYTQSSTIKTYSITLSYNSIVDTYVLQQKHFAEIFGITGALIVFFYFLGIVLIEPFNEFKKNYLVGKNLHLPYKVSRAKLLYLDSEEHEAYLIAAWIWSFCYKYICCRCSILDCFKTKRMQVILYLVKKGQQQLNFSTFFKKYLDLKYTLDSYVSLQSNPDIPASSVFTRLPFVQGAPLNPYQSESSQLRRYFRVNNLSSHQQHNLDQQLSRKSITQIDNRLQHNSKLRKLLQGKNDQNMKGMSEYQQQYPQGYRGKQQIQVRNEQDIDKGGQTKQKQYLNESHQQLIQKMDKQGVNIIPLREISEIHPTQVQGSSPIPGLSNTQSGFDFNLPSSERGEQVQKQEASESKKVPPE